MAIIVKKFGGTSVGSIELIRNIARRIATGHQPGDSLVLVERLDLKECGYLQVDCSRLRLLSLNVLQPRSFRPGAILPNSRLTWRNARWNV